jgi:hypothetical protein
MRCTHEDLVLTHIYRDRAIVRRSYTCRSCNYKKIMTFDVDTNEVIEVQE